jgi:hypothetical protein
MREGTRVAGDGLSTSDRALRNCQTAPAAWAGDGFQRDAVDHLASIATTTVGTTGRICDGGGDNRVDPARRDAPFSVTLPVPGDRDG